MINRVAISNWQSLRAVDLSLGRFTVIVGASNSGKTALIRALRAAANNTRRRGNITRGAKTATIAVHTDAAVVILERTETSSTYSVAGAAGDTVTDGGARLTFTKLAGGVPEQVSAALGIPPAAAGQSLHIAGQFDPPFLVDESGAAVARTLGDLTNVTTLFEAVREANRRRNALAGTLKTRQADLDATRAAARTFATLPAQLTAVEVAEQAAAGAQRLAERIGRLRRAADSLQVAETVLTRAAVPAVPADDALLAAAARRARFLTLLRELRSATTSATAATAAVDQADADVAALHDELHAALAAAGTCPTCGQHVPA